MFTCFVILGLKEVGIFRLPGSTTRVNELKESFNEGLSLLQLLFSDI